SRLRATVVLTIASVLLAVVQPVGAAAAGTGNASINLTQTLGAPTMAPVLTLTLAVDHAKAIPGDTLTYTSTVTNTGASLGLTGSYFAANNGNIMATVSAYYDDIEYYSVAKKAWVALAGTAASQQGYAPLVTPPATNGMTLSAKAVAASGVTYPSTGDPIVGTQINTTSTASWNFQASVSVTPTQIAMLADPKQVNGLRNVVHFEVTPRATSQGQPFIYRSDVTNLFQSQSVAATNVTVTIAQPTGSPVRFNSSSTPSLASLAPGASVTVTSSYQVPVPTAKGATESDAAYLTRLRGIEGTVLNATATASGTSASGTVTASAPSVSTTEDLPIMSISKSGPLTPVPAGSTATYPLALQNTGGADASGMAITDTVPSGATGSVTGIPTTLAPGAASSGTQATFLVPVNQSVGSLTDTASLTWQDHHGNVYGPVSSLFTTQVQAANKLSITGDAGPKPSRRRSST
ncbi:MAG: hypothetical protein E6I78_13170, partial [Chloroflexi bacterium]